MAPVLNLFYDFVNTFHLVKRNRFLRINEVHETAETASALFVHQFRVFFEELVASPVL